MNSKFYITTPIYYVNSKPHIGTLYSTLIADTLARFARLCGKEVYFLTGTDEHGQKILERAREQGIDPKAFVDSIVPEFKKVWERFNIDYSYFIRTTDDAHKKAVVGWLKELLNKGDIYLSEYSGWYCVPCETFVNLADHADDVQPECPTCLRLCQQVSEQGYFFRLSAYEDQLLQFYADNPDFIMPRERLNEVISFVRGGLKDLCISRKGLTWGIPFPGDDEQSVYVWADALNNYITAIGYGSDKPEDIASLKKWWPADVQVMAKDIVRFHAVYWPAFLMAAHMPLPKKLLVHGFILNDDEKISKSKGNVIDPLPLAAMYGVDQVRYFLMRHMAITHDGSYSEKRLAQSIGSELANDLGNLLQRTVSLALKHKLATVKPSQTWEAAAAQLREYCRQSFQSYYDAMKRGNVHSALQAVWTLVGQANAFFHAQMPWLTAKKEPELFEEIISASCHCLQAIALMALPVMPEKMKTLLACLGQKYQDGTDYEQILRTNEWTTMFELKKPAQPLFVRPDMQDEKEPKAASSSAQAPEPAYETIQIGDFAKVQLWVGTIEHAEAMKGSDKLLQLTVNMGPHGMRTILAGVAPHCTPEALIGKQGIYVGNLKPRKMMGTESQGMMLFAKDSSGALVMATVAEPVANGTRLM